MTRLRILKPLRERDFRLLMVGQATSLVGDGVFTVALAWQAYELSARPTALSFVLMARSVPMIIFLLIGGAITDRFSRRTVMLISDIVRGIVVGLVAALAVNEALQLWHLVVLAAIFGVADAFFIPAYTSIAPELLSADMLLHANALESAVRPLAMRLVGPALGGVIVGQVGTAPAFVVDAATFAVSAINLMAMRRRPAPSHTRIGLLQEIAEGYRYARSEAWIWVQMVVAALAVMLAVGPFDVLMPLIVKDRLNGGAEVYGAIIAASGAGGILAAVVASYRGNPPRRITAMLLLWSIGTLTLGLQALPREIILTVALAGISGFAIQYGAVLWATMAQEWIPNRLLGRVRSLDFLVTFGLMPVSYALAGPIALVVGAVPTLAIGGILSGIMWLVGLFWPHVRDREAAAQTAT